MDGRVRVGKAGSPRPGRGRTLRVGDRRIALFNVGGRCYAIDDRCSHMGGPLGEGELQGRAVICPWHAARFDVCTGIVLSPPAGANVRAYMVKTERDAVVISLDE